jgi:apolipoprotein D and lipocalin family protein
MSSHKTRSRPIVAVLLAAALLGCSGTEPAVVENLDLTRLEGRWYEIARVPRDHDRTCRDTTADYRLRDPRTLELTHGCRLGSLDGPLKRFATTASVDDPAEPAKLSLDLGLYRGAYWVIALGPDAEYAVIGHPSLTLLWVLARSPALPPATYDHVVDLARKQGFDVGSLVPTPQSAP